MAIENTVLFDYLKKLQKHDATRKEIDAKRSELNKQAYFNELGFDETNKGLYEYLRQATYEPLESAFDYLLKHQTTTENI